jgi:hypothetical protein
MKLVRYKHGSLQSSTVMLPGTEGGVSDEVRLSPKPLDFECCLPKTIMLWREGPKP